jgi:hypothetical protein
VSGRGIRRGRNAATKEKLKQRFLQIDCHLKVLLIYAIAG